MPKSLRVMFKQLQLNKRITNEEYKDFIDNLDKHDDELEKLAIIIYLQKWLSTFNTDSATECFTAVQELKKQIEKKQNT